MLFRGMGLFLGGVLVGGAVVKLFTPNLVVRGQIIREGQDHLVNPILSCEIGAKEDFTEFSTIKWNLGTVVQKKIQDGSAANISVYLRTMNSGRWTGIAEDQTYAPASLLKVVVMMAYYKDVEQNPSLLNQYLVYNEPVENTNVPTEKLLKRGASYRIDELIKNMIVDSNNQALYTLLDGANPKSITNVFNELNIRLAPSQREEDLDYMSPKTYGMIFRILYGATYLNKEMSNKALELLSHTTFTDGIAAGVPNTITVSHKFGARTAIAKDGLLAGKEAKELHDCGIVYYPDHPYMLCVMTRGTDFNALTKTIAEISQNAYLAIDTFFKK